MVVTVRRPMRGHSITSYAKATPSGSFKPFFGRVFVGKDLEVVGVADLLAGVDVNPNGLHRKNPGRSWRASSGAHGWSLIATLARPRVIEEVQGRVDLL